MSLVSRLAWKIYRLGNFVRELNLDEMSIANCRVYVGNLDFKVTSEELERVMADAGTVVKTDVVKGTNGFSKGFALVEFSDVAGAENAISTLGDRKVGERAIFVREDREPEDRPNGRGEGKYSEGKGKGKGKGGKGKGKGKGTSKGNGRRAGITPLRVRPEDKGRLLYIGNIPWRASWQDLKDIFRDCGEVIRVDIAEDRDGRSRGYATILFEKEEEAQAAIKAFNETEFEGRKLIVREDHFADKAAGRGGDRDHDDTSEH